MDVVTLRNVSKTYRTDSLTVQALKGIDLALEEGKFVSFIGPSGSGKTTLLNLNTSLRFGTHTEHTNDGGLTVDHVEAFGSLRLSQSSTISLGKRVFLRGEGYASSFVGRVNPVKDAEKLKTGPEGLLGSTPST